MRISLSRSLALSKHEGGWDAGLPADLSLALSLYLSLSLFIALSICMYLSLSECAAGTQDYLLIAQEVGDASLLRWDVGYFTTDQVHFILSRSAKVNSRTN